MGYDAKRAFNNRTGLGNYARTLISGVEAQCPHWPLFLFTPHIRMPFECQAQVITPQTPLGQALPALWRSYGVARQTAQMKLDLFHGLSQEIPRGIHRTTKTVVTIHDVISLLRPQDFSWPNHTLYNAKLRYSAHHAHRILTFSEDCKKHLILLLKVPEKKITILPQSCHEAFLQNYSADEISQCLQKYSLPRHFIHFVGSFIERKKPHKALEAYCQMAQDTELDFVMLGHGPLRKQCQELARTRGLEVRVHFATPESPEEMAKISQASQLLLYPSVAEGFGIPILEAHFSRTAVMTSPYSCLPEIAGDHAFYTNPDDGKEFTATLKHALGPSKEREQKAQASYQWAQQFTPQAVSTRLINYYQSLW